MSAIHEARLHLAKSAEFLGAAQASLDAGFFNAATSDAVLAGINAKDAICLKLTGRTRKTENHNDAVDDLSRAGRAAADLAPTMSRLIKLKSRSQYQSASVAQQDARSAVEWAQRMCDAAKAILTA